MNKLLERWFQIRYTIYSPLYNWVGRLFMAQRKRSIFLADIHKGDNILILGAGSGLDLEYLSNDVRITVVDISPAMLFKLQKKANSLNLKVDAKVMDARNLSFPDCSFDVILLHMIIAVVPDYKRVMKEVHRVVKQGGVIMIFDKLLPNDQKITFFRKIINPFAIFIASDLNRQSKEFVNTSDFINTIDEKAGWGGLLRILKLVKKE